MFELFLAFALGIGGPVTGNLTDSSSAWAANSDPRGHLLNSEAKMRSVRPTEHRVIQDHTRDIGIIKPAVGRDGHKHRNGLTSAHGMPVRHQIATERSARRLMRQLTTDNNIGGNRRTDILDSKANRMPKAELVIDYLQLRHQPCPLLPCRNLIGPAGFEKREPDQPRTDNAGRHASYRGDPHVLRPDCDDLLGFKLALIAISFVAGLICLSYAIYLYRFDPDPIAMVPYFYPGALAITLCLIAGDAAMQNHFC